MGVVGGLQTVARHLVSYLLGDEGEVSKIGEGKNVPLVKVSQSLLLIPLP